MLPWTTLARFGPVANFSIRGLGITASIPSIDPTVGVFIDGVYMGQNAGVVIDMFDIESIEVLRGPQGTLFGRNVTGGAVLINSKRPTDELEFSVRGAVDGNPNGDGGLNYYLMSSISAPFTDSFGGRLSVYHNNDKGWFENGFDGSNHGKSETTIIRPVFAWSPTEDLEFLFRWEHMETEGDGPTAQSHENGLGVAPAFAPFERDSFDFAIDERGLQDVEVDFVTLQMDWDVDFGNGTVTGIYGYRDYGMSAVSDIDAQPVWLFHAPAWLESEQSSFELRYTGNFGDATVTTGLYWFEMDMLYHERRELLGIATGGVAPAATQDGGGDYSVESKAWFGTVDYALNDSWFVTGGLRYTQEDKSAKIASLIFNVNKPCNVVLEGNCPFDFQDSNDWNAWSGKLGATWLLSNDRRIYGHWSRSQRSGGYNLRNTAVDTVNFGPGPFDEEVVDSFELGYKSEFAGKGRFNAAVFYNQVDDMQREVNLADPLAGVVQVIKNTANARLMGVELDGVFAISDTTLIMASLGYVDPKYTDVFFDLNGDGVVNEADKRLKLPRAAELTYSVGLTQDWIYDNGSNLSFRISYSYRDDAFYSDNNLGYFLDQDIVDAGFDYRTADGHWIFSVYGRNLLNSVNHGGDTQLPSNLLGIPIGGTFSPLAKGRVVGLEFTYNL